MTQQENHRTRIWPRLIPLQSLCTFHGRHQPLNIKFINQKLTPAGPRPAHCTEWVTDQKGSQNIHRARSKIDKQTPDLSPHPSGAERSPPAYQLWLSSTEPPELSILYERAHMAWTPWLQVNQLGLSHPSLGLWKWVILSTFGRRINSPLPCTCPWSQAFQRERGSSF